MEEKRSSLPLVVAAIILFVPLLYVGSYVLLLQPVELDLSSNSSRPLVYHYEFYAADPNYQPLLRRIFYPLHKIDRDLIRRDYWKAPDLP